MDREMNGYQHHKVTRLVTSTTRTSSTREKLIKSKASVASPQVVGVVSAGSCSLCIPKRAGLNHAQPTTKAAKATQTLVAKIRPTQNNCSLETYTTVNNAIAKALTGHRS